MTRLAVFDCDGTLVDSQANICRAMEEAFVTADLFVTLQTAGRHPSKPDPAMLHAALAEAGVEPHMAAMVGDTSFDMAMARAGGARAVGVAWGYHSVAELGRAGADVIARSAADLPGLLA